MLKGQKGITLVALVITIIVLLILAGVTISLTLGEDGIFKMAQDATHNYANAADKERDENNRITNTAEKYVYNVTH